MTRRTDNLAARHPSTEAEKRLRKTAMGEIQQIQEQLAEVERRLAEIELAMKDGA